MRNLSGSLWLSQTNFSAVTASTASPSITHLSQTILSISSFYTKARKQSLRFENCFHFLPSALEHIHTAELSPLQEMTPLFRKKNKQLPLGCDYESFAIKTSARRRLTQLCQECAQEETATQAPPRKKFAGVLRLPKPHRLRTVFYPYCKSTTGVVQ